MKHKMNLLCVVIFIFTVLMPVAEFSGAFFSSNDELKLTEVDVYPTHIGDDNSFRMKDVKTGKDVKAWAKSVMIEVEESAVKERSGWYHVMLLPLPIIAFVTWFMFYVFFIKFVIAINKGEVFTWKTISLLRKAGWAWLISQVSGIALLFFAKGETTLMGYATDYSKIIEDIPDLLTGLLLLMMAQIFSIGLRQKEELEQVI
jgi:hypothetical protein